MRSEVPVGKGSTIMLVGVSIETSIDSRHAAVRKVSTAVKGAPEGKLIARLKVTM